MRPVTSTLFICVAAGQTYKCAVTTREECTSLVDAARSDVGNLTDQGSCPTTDVLARHEHWREVDRASRACDDWMVDAHLARLSSYNLDRETTSDVNGETTLQETSGSMTERRAYADPQAIMGRSRSQETRGESTNAEM
ncbi:hypothetical protein PHMEG_00020495 [Phytophthora megakarya]|uniref:Uncharacterized protein n=1 Tax=Phytophthora megakarya TaxID=4795 RepID=A0A225VP76_9STRA|nr:hypothetical protein PHMEG_00020495 [Phytophthora megakarya]